MNAIPFKIFGLQRTATNLSQLLLTRNFRVFYADIGTEWKHGRLVNPHRRINDELVRFVFCVRNPYSWLISCYTHYAKNRGVLRFIAPQFLDNPEMRFEDFVLSPFFNYETPIVCWNELNRHWLAELPLDLTMMIRQEDQLTKQLDMLQLIEKKLGVKRKGTDLLTEDRHVDFGLGRGDLLNPAAYRTESHILEYPRQLLDLVNQTLDWDLMTKLGYERKTLPAIDTPPDPPVIAPDFAHPTETRKGIVIYGAIGHKFANTWIAIRLLRSGGCSLPIEFCYSADQPAGQTIEKLLTPLDVRLRLIDAAPSAASRLHAIIQSQFQQVLFLEAEHIPLANPTFLFDSDSFQKTGAVFWPGFFAGIDGTIILLDKFRCLELLRRALTLINEKNLPLSDALQSTWQSHGAPKWLVTHPLKLGLLAVCQHDFDDRPLFQRRTLCWEMRNNFLTSTFARFDECLDALEELSSHWRSIAGISIYHHTAKTPAEQAVADRLINTTWLYERVGWDHRYMTFRPDGTIDDGAFRAETYWDLLTVDGIIHLDIQSPRDLTCRLHLTQNGVWQGQWEKHDRMDIRVYPSAIPTNAVRQHRETTPPEIHHLQHIVAELFCRDQPISFVQIGDAPFDERMYPPTWRGVIATSNSQLFSQLRDKHRQSPNIKVLHGSIRSGAATPSSPDSSSISDLLKMLERAHCDFFALDAGEGDIELVRSLFQTRAKPTLLAVFNRPDSPRSDEIDDFLRDLLSYCCILQNVSVRVWITFHGIQ